MTTKIQALPGKKIKPDNVSSQQVSKTPSQTEAKNQMNVQANITNVNISIFNSNQPPSQNIATKPEIGNESENSIFNKPPAENNFSEASNDFDTKKIFDMNGDKKLNEVDAEAAKIASDENKDGIVDPMELMTFMKNRAEQFGEKVDEASLIHQFGKDLVNSPELQSVIKSLLSLNPFGNKNKEAQNAQENGQQANGSQAAGQSAAGQSAGQRAMGVPNPTQEAGKSSSPTGASGTPKASSTPSTGSSSGAEKTAAPKGTESLDTKKATGEEDVNVLKELKEAKDKNLNEVDKELKQNETDKAKKEEEKAKVSEEAEKLNKETENLQKEKVEAEKKATEHQTKSKEHTDKAKTHKDNQQQLNSEVTSTDKEISGLQNAISAKESQPVKEGETPPSTEAERAQIEQLNAKKQELQAKIKEEEQAEKQEELKAKEEEKQAKEAEKQAQDTEQKITKAKEDLAKKQETVNKLNEEIIELKIEHANLFAKKDILEQDITMLTGLINKKTAEKSEEEVKTQSPNLFNTKINSFSLIS